MKNSKKLITSWFAESGITINGDNPYDIQVHNKALYSRIIRQGSLGLGEAYMDGWWDAERLDEFFFRIFRSSVDRHIRLNKRFLFAYLKEHVMNPQRFSKAYEIGEKHYDVGNDLYKRMLDSRMTYTCGYWKNAKTLDDAQAAKLDLTCRKLGLKRGDRVLDIGSGWGSFMKYAAETYDIRAVGLTVSKQQKVLADEMCKGLSVETRLLDYRNIHADEKFDHIVSLGMFEHVGYKNYKVFFDVVSEHLKDDGLFLLHTIGSNTSIRVADRWVLRYIFPNSTLPSPLEIGRVIQQHFTLEDWHNFGADYDRTLMAWYENIKNAWPDLQDIYSNRFYRMWTYYLLSFAGAFRSRRKTQLWQIVLSKKGVLGGYQSIR